MMPFFFDAFSAALLIAGSVLWLLAIVAEYVSTCHPVRGQYPTPCFEERKFSGYNFVFVALPIATVMAAQMRMLNALGALGLTCIVEAACLLGVTGYEQIIAIHPMVANLAGIASTLICLNVGWLCGVTMGAPLLALAVLVLVCRPPTETATHMFTGMSALYWAMDVWLILARIAMLFFGADVGWVNHFWLDVYSAAALVVGGGIACAIEQRRHSNVWPSADEEEDDGEAAATGASTPAVRACPGRHGPEDARQS